MASLYQEKIQEIITWIKRDYLNEKGLVVQPMKNGDRIPLLNDLGDYSPFFRHAGEDAFCEDQLRELLNNLKGDLLVPSRKMAKLGFITPYEHSDLILGLLDDYALTKDKKKLDLAKKITARVLDRFKLTKIKSSFYLPSIRLRLPVFDSLDGMYIELLVLLFEFTENKKYLELAENIAYQMLELPLFKQEKLFPSLFSKVPWLFPANIKKRFNEVHLMKNNTNTVFGLLELYKVKPLPKIEEAIFDWIMAVKDKLQNPDGSICGVSYFKNGKIETGVVDLTPNFAVLDSVCDAYHQFKNPIYLDFAKKIGDYWLSKQAQETGLLPWYPEKEKQESYLDSETDMLIALRKLSEISGGKKYREAADRIMHGIIKYHRGEGGYYLKVNIQTGEPTDTLFKVKFITLFLKALILYDGDKTIYNNPDLFDLLKDR